jgi:hypothetical protein
MTDKNNYPTPAGYAHKGEGKAAAAEWEIGPCEEVLRDLCSPHLDVEAFTAVFDLSEWIFGNPDLSANANINFPEED